MSKVGCGVDCAVTKAVGCHLISKYPDNSVDDIHYLVGSSCVQYKYGKVLARIVGRSGQDRHAVLFAQVLPDLLDQVAVQVPHPPLLADRPASSSVDRVHQLLPEFARCFVNQAIDILAASACGSFLTSG